MIRASSSWQRVVAFGAGLLCAAPLAAASAVGGEPGDRVAYERYCASCHGTPGRAPGPAAAALRRPPPDLGGLEGRHGSPLPRAALLHTVLDPRRRGGLSVCGAHPFGHGARDVAAVLATRGAVLGALEYLETVQGPAAAP